MSKLNINVSGGNLRIGSINQGSTVNISSVDKSDDDGLPYSSSKKAEPLATNDQDKPSTLTGSSLHVFLSYSHQDEIFKDELEKHLKLLQRQGLISLWQDHKIMPGDSWDSQIEAELCKADIILLLVSADFIASDYCWDKEMKIALTRNASGDASVVPILVRPCDWKTTAFAKLQGLPDGMTPISVWENRDAAWLSVVQGLRRLIINKKIKT